MCRGGAAASSAALIPAPQQPRRARFEHHRGALAMGSDVLVAQLTLEEAQLKCVSLPLAVGFTFCSAEAHPRGLVWCYFKSSMVANTDPLWQRYMQQSDAAPLPQQHEQLRARTAPEQQLGMQNHIGLGHMNHWPAEQYRLPQQPHAVPARQAPAAAAASKPRPSAIRASPSPDAAYHPPMKPSPKREPKRYEHNQSTGCVQSPDLL